MAETLDELVAYLAGRPRSPFGNTIRHLGDTRATDMGRRGELNVGELMREKYGDDAVLVGFSTYQGTVTAAPTASGDPMDACRRRKKIRTCPSSIAVDAVVFKLRPDVPAGPRQIRSYTRQGHEPSSTSPTVLRGEARKTPPPELSAVRKVHRGDRSLTQCGCLLVDAVSCSLIPKGRGYRELAGRSYRPSAHRRGSSRTVELC
jgi:hypothetical protein